MKEVLRLPERLLGDVFHYQYARRPHAEHHHAELELNFVLRGSAAYLLGDRRYALRRHMLVWLFPEQEHVLIGESDDFAAWIGVFAPPLVQSVCTSRSARVLAEPNPPGVFCQRLGEDAGAWLAALLAQVDRARGEPSHFNAGLGYALLSAWAAFSAVEGDAPQGTDIHPAVESAVRILVQQADNSSLGDVARAAGLSESRLRTLFRQQIGMTPTAFRSQQRVKRFLRLYGHGQRVSMTQAALDAGFGSYTQFHRVFKGVMGCGPADFGRAQQGARQKPSGPR